MNKHTATFAGHVWTRNSKGRKYSHMVVGVESIAAQRARAEEHARHDWKTNHGWYVERAKGGVYVGTFLDGSTYNHIITPAEQVGAQAFLEGGVEGHVARRLADFDAKIAANHLKTPDGLSTVYSKGWTSRLDLAVKLAARTPGGVVVEATLKS